MFKAYGWLVYSGIKEVFLILGAVQIAVRFLTVLMCELACYLKIPTRLSAPLYYGDGFCPRVSVLDLTRHCEIDIFGKRNWNFFHRHDLSEKSGLR